MKRTSIIAICALGLTVSACALPRYTPNPGDPYDFKGDLNHLGAPVPDAPPAHKSFFSGWFE